MHRVNIPATPLADVLFACYSSFRVSRHVDWLENGTLAATSRPLGAPAQTRCEPGRRFEARATYVDPNKASPLRPCPILRGIGVFLFSQTRENAFCRLRPLKTATSLAAKPMPALHSGFVHFRVLVITW